MSKEIEKIDIYIPELEAIPDVERRRPWTEWEESVLREYYARKPAEAIAKVLNRSAAAIQQKARTMGISAIGEDK